MPVTFKHLNALQLSHVGQGFRCGSAYIDKRRPDQVGNQVGRFAMANQSKREIYDPDGFGRGDDGTDDHERRSAFECHENPLHEGLRAVFKQGGLLLQRSACANRDIAYLCPRQELHILRPGRAQHDDVVLSQFKSPRRTGPRPCFVEQHACRGHLAEPIHACFFCDGDEPEVLEQIYPRAKQRHVSQHCTIEDDVLGEGQICGGMEAPHQDLQGHLEVGRDHEDDPALPRKTSARRDFPVLVTVPHDDDAHREECHLRNNGGRCGQNPLVALSVGGIVVLLLLSHLAGLHNGKVHQLNDKRGDHG
mmetsp:Transcript_89553/g.258360  ORF Transcript_89553/g.258360 Transcript_89553/m.258360 type:complete len:306 (+) Transcript_89553:220-1137(+)